ncbi:hypothetical protein G7054_g10419 [Neopestalotiopsis clavispora]|nr:hypothetical protein G7054_g10419 [Neopestalotiopsis clavispora]
MQTVTHSIAPDSKISDDPSATKIVARTPLLEVGSPRAYELVSVPLINCIEHHSAYMSPALNQSLRRLSLTAKILCILSSFNVSDYPTHGIDIRVLGQTIRDAIQVTHRLCIEYLWVDALCIIQDSDEDKANELAQMGNIHRDAYLTIIASSATKASTGFLETRTPAPEYEEHLRLPFHCRDGRIGSIFVYAQDSPASAYNTMKEPANSCAWCFQERLLSPRKLVYASDTV